jgi:hypothetical protein
LGNKLKNGTDDDDDDVLQFEEHEENSSSYDSVGSDWLNE